MRKKDAGFTLTELMVVVAIIGILASVAVLSFRRYTVRVKVGEAYSMLGLIKAREEVYRAEFNQYCGAAYHPNGGTTATAQTQSWGTGAAVPTAWQQVGVRPDQDLYFVYQVSAGSPGANPNPGFDATLGAPPGHPLADDFYFVATAKADLDGDGADSAFELCSTCRSVYVERTAADYEGE